MNWAVLPAKTAFPEFATEWDRLNGHLYQDHPFFDSRFLGPLLKHFGSDREKLCVFRPSETGPATGALILSPCGPGRWTNFRPSQAQISPLLIDDSSHLAGLFAVLPGLPWTIEFHALDPRYAPDFTRLRLPQMAIAQAYTIGIQPIDTFQPYWEQRSRNLAKNMRRYFRRVESEGGGLRIVSYGDPAEIDACVERYAVLESAGWKGKVGTALAPGNTQSLFYKDMLRRFAATGQAVVYELYIGQHLAASRLVVNSSGMLIILKTTYDESLSRFAPGRLQLYRLIEEEFANPLHRTIEFYTNATLDQQEWATFGCTIRNLQVFRNNTAAAAFSMIRSGRDRLLRGLGGFPEDVPAGASIRTASSISGLRRAFDNLATLQAAASFDLTPDWFDLLQSEVYPDDPEICYYVSSDKRGPRVILPVRRIRNGSLETIESLGNFYTALYAPLLGQDGELIDLQPILATLIREHPRTQIMRFSPMDPHSPAYLSLFSALRAVNWIPFGYFCFGNWFLQVQGSWSDYLRQRSATQRSAIRRRCRRFTAEGGTLSIIQTNTDIENAIRRFQAIYSASWKKPEPYPEFIPSLLRRLAASGNLRLGFASLGDRDIAAQLWFVHDRKASIYKVAYHEQFAAYSPGTVLTAHLMEHVIDRDQVREVDFLIGDDAYKSRWMSHRRERWGIIAYNPVTLPGCALLLREIGGRLVRSVNRRLREWRGRGDEKTPERKQGSTD